MTNIPMLPLPPGTIDLWVAPVSLAPESELSRQFDQVLSAEERQRHDRFMFEKDRRRFLVTRALVRQVLSSYLPIAPADWQFAATDFGRPYITNALPEVAGLTFNLSHSNQTVVLAVTRDRQLGVDVEDVQREAPLEVADRFFTPDEVRQLHGLSPEHRSRRFLDFWTLKESYIKARGKGLSLPLDQFGFEVMDALPDRGPTRLSSNPTLRFFADPAIDDQAGCWAFWQWRPSPESLAALCVERQAGVPLSVQVRRMSFDGPPQSMAFEVIRSSAS